MPSAEKKVASTNSLWCHQWTVVACLVMELKETAGGFGRTVSVISPS